MFGKLIKYEFRATRRVMLPLLAAVVVLSPLAGLCWKTMFTGTLGKIISSFVSTIFTVAVAAVFIASFVLMIRRFHASFLSDEGYLTFTLPVRTSALVFAKLITAFVWFVAAAVSCVIGGALITLVTRSSGNFSGIFTYIREFTRMIGVGNVVLYVFEAILCAFLFSSYISLHFYAAMALGHSFSTRHKTLLSVVAYVLLSIVMTLLLVLFFRLANAGGLITSAIERIGTRIAAFTISREYASIPHLLSGLAALWLTVCCALYYVPTILPLNKKLNLN